MATNEIQLYKDLRGKFGENTAQMIVEGINETVKDEFTRNKEILATKRDIDTAKHDLLKYMFAQTIAIIGIVVALIKLL